MLTSLFHRNDKKDRKKKNEMKKKDVFHIVWMKTRKEEKEMKKYEGVREYLLFIFLAWRVCSEVPLKERSR